MKFITQEKETEFKQVLNEVGAYKREIMRIAELWADLMEIRIELGETVVECAQECLDKTNCESGMMAQSAKGLLIIGWLYGKELVGLEIY